MMDILTNKNVLLGITGSIAAYKAADISSRLKKEGCNVRVVMTKSSELFITETTLESLSGNKVISEDEHSNTLSNFEHLDIAKWADIILISPCTANFMNKLANGHGDDLLSTICLAFTKKIFVAPAMNPDMWNNKVSQSSVKKLKEADINIIGPNYGSHACGDIGYGRMTSPEQIIEDIKGQNKSSVLSGIRVLVTAGPTREPIDPVRFISNRSSGKQGYAIASILSQYGAKTTLVAGPTNLTDPPGVNTIKIETAADMLQACLDSLPADIAICAAAVADWHVVHSSEQKLKKQYNSSTSNLKLNENPDILKTISQLDANRPNLVIGFAAETENLLNNAIHKRKNKGCDWILANDVSASTETFGGDNNRIHLITDEGSEEWPRMLKGDVAIRLVEKIVNEVISK